MKRATDPAHLEAIANHPRIRPFIGGDPSVPVKAGQSWARTVALEWPEGGVIFIAETPAVYSAHLVFQRKTKDPLPRCLEALDYLFGLGASAVVADIPPGYRHVRRIAQAAGMKERNGRWWLTAHEHRAKE